jgi:hypothetical protein
MQQDAGSFTPLGAVDAGMGLAFMVIRSVSGSMKNEG